MGVGRGVAGLLVVAAVLVSGCQAWPTRGADQGSGEGPQETVAPAGEMVVGTTRVVRAQRVLPAHVAGLDIEFDVGAAVRVERLAGRLADLLAVNVVIEERPPRDGRIVELADPGPLRIKAEKSARALLDEVAARSGYEWEYTEAPSARIVFYRYRDAAWSARLAPEAAPPEPEPEPEPEQTVWRIDPAEHMTIRGVVEAWAKGAGWTVVWEAAELDYAVTAKAEFHGTFEEAVDGLFRDTRGYRALIPTAWRANRYLTVKAGG